VFANPNFLALGFRVVLVLFALVFGFLGRRTRVGLVGFVGSAVLLTILLVMVFALVSRPAVRTVAPATPSVPVK
jgi:hypothetical protein